ncbi:hypothetical protein CEQ15_11270 [Chryseobacterium indologenes]|uniref:DUF6520 family protein n=1 Tax=Chryseobacterium indologenes TaxID=253 RepID=UPI000B51C76D|nr:DUF6520 family protein [Chryseobacterium indologenes]ASE62028.1 hypothetical protein CEQ15_11270 [Chryseobacterium indologenes]
MKKILMPAIILGLGAGAAFATNSNINAKKALVDAYRFDNAQNLCVKVQQQCSNIESPEVCTWSENASITLHEQGETMCGNELYKIPQN